MTMPQEPVFRDPAPPELQDTSSPAAAPDPTGSARLRTDGLSVTFGGVKAVVDVSLTLEPGTLYGLVGPNGSGKTTFLNAISRLVPTSHGSMWFNGQDYTRIPDTRVASIGISRTFQNIRLLNLLNVEDNVKLGADVVGGRKRNLDWWFGRRAARRENAHVAELAAEALERVGLTHAARRDPSTLSYGMQRRVEIARAIAMKPQLLLLDEPTAGMREDERTDIMELSRSLVADGMTVLLVEHNLRMITSICQHLFVMYFGNCIASGDPRQVMRMPAVQQAYIGHSADVTV
jgi:branched-chain amino acid transport system ATP-binding protein